jgi:hypothetical protein
MSKDSTTKTEKMEDTKSSDSKQEVSLAIQAATKKHEEKMGALGVSDLVMVKQGAEAVCALFVACRSSDFEVFYLRFLNHFREFLLVFTIIRSVCSKSDFQNSIGTQYWTRN